MLGTAGGGGDLSTCATKLTTAQSSLTAALIGLMLSANKVCPRLVHLAFESALGRKRRMQFEKLLKS